VHPPPRDPISSRQPIESRRPSRFSVLPSVRQSVLGWSVIAALHLGLVASLPAQSTVSPPRNIRVKVTVNGVPVGATPRLGAHTLAFHRYGGNAAPLTTDALTTQATGSTLLVCVGRGDLSAVSLPRDNKGNSPYQQLGSAHPYTLWNSSGTALYTFPSAAGGTSHTFTTDTPPGDEITMAVVEVTTGGVIKDYQWNEVLSDLPTTSANVTTTGPATLVAFWWGDAGVDGNKTAQPDNGFVVIDSLLDAGALVQCAVATKEVTAAGTYNVTWTATPRQGAQLWLVAVQHAL